MQGLRFTVTGVQNLPTTGGAVVAINHTSYFDFTFAGLPAYDQGLGRKVRFMAKKEVFDHKIGGPLMRGMRHIPVDRGSGADSFDAACQALKNGELVGVYPEATISRSFELKEFKSGAARMAIAAGVPIVPHIVWGAQRIWTKDHPRRMWRPKVPISVAVGEPIMPTLPAAELTASVGPREYVGYLREMVSGLLSRRASQIIQDSRAAVMYSNKLCKKKSMHRDRRFGSKI